MHDAVSSPDILQLTGHQEGGKATFKGLTFLADGIFVLYLLFHSSSQAEQKENT